MSALSIRNVRKVFGAVTVLDNIDLEAESGEFIILVGASGCGKSTLLNMIAGLDVPTSGTIHIADRDVTHLPSKDRDIAMVFQSYALYPTMSVAQNISFGLEMRKVPKPERDKAIARVAKMLQIEHLLDRKPAQLSGGQRQRVAMGRALARDPKLFLFDEPLSNLDAKLRAQTRLEIQKLHRELGITSLFVTHDQVEAMTLAERMIVMNAGNMEQFGTPEEVYTRPATTFVASFIGSPPMNLLKHAPGGRAGSILGIRPEHIDIGNEGWALKVETVELLGAERLVHTRLGDEGMIIRTHEDQGAPAIGSTIHAKPREDRLHWFDAETGRRQ